jgi:serine/threonine protein kinase
MAPEQARGLWDAVDGRSDLWAVGATMFCLLSGRPVHKGRTTNEQLLSAMTRPAPSLRSVLPEISAPVAGVVDRALAFNKALRWQDARAMQEAVRHAYHDRTGASIATAPRLTVPESVRNRTLAGTPSGLLRGLPTTVRPVARASSRLFLDQPRSVRALMAAAVLGGAVLLGILGSGVARLMSRSVGTAAPAVVPLNAARDGTSPASPERGLHLDGTSPASPERGLHLETAQAVAFPAGTTLVAASSVDPGTDPKEALSPPVIAATDLPSAVPVPPSTPPAWIGRPSVPSTGSPGSKGNCSPPYVINPATGKKNWKVECL